MFCACALASQNMHFSFHEISEKDGLPQSNQYLFLTDSKGFVWIGSDNGLLRFDGKNLLKFQNDNESKYSLYENRITSKCVEDAEGNLWFTSFGALNCYLRKTNGFVHYKIESTTKNYSLLSRQGSKLSLQIGLGDEGNLYFFDINLKKFTKDISLSGYKCLPIHNDTGRVIQLLSLSLPNSSGLQYIDRETKNSVHVKFEINTNGEIKNFFGPAKTAWIDDRDTAWIGLYNSLGKYTLGQSFGIIHEERDMGIEEDVGWINDIIKYNTNLLLIAADNGLLLFDINKSKFIHQFKKFSNSNYPLNLKGINNMNLDTLGNLWLSGTNQKIAFANINKNRFPRLEQTSGISLVNLSEDQDGNVWCSTLDSGTYVFTPEKELLFNTKRLRNPNFENGFNPLPEIYFFLKNDKNEWWGNIGNYFFLWDKTFKEFKIDFSYFLGVANTDYDRINFCYTLSNGKMLVARGKEIYEIKLSKSKVDTLPWFSLESFDIKKINRIYQDQSENIFISDDYGKLLIVQVRKGFLTLVANIPEFGIIHAFREDTKREKIWVASTKGLGAFDSNTLDYELYYSNTEITNEGVLTDIVQDKTGRLWLSSGNGIIRLNPDNNEIHQFNTADGLLSNVFSKNSSLISSKTGEIWVGGQNGINVFNPDEIKLLTRKPKPQLINLLVNDEPFQLEKNITEIKKLKLPFLQNTLSFQFAPLDYADPSSNEYMYQMVGLDDTPVSNSTRGFARYGNIPAGKYHFKIWATNSDLVLNDTPSVLSIEIIPPFYQTWWFYLFCILGIAVIIYGIFQYRIAQILKVERLRTRIASDLHDDVGGILSGLAMQSELLELTAKEEEKGKLKQLADMSRSAMSGMRDTVWAIDSRKDKFEDLLDRIREHAEEVLIPKEFHYFIDSHEIQLSLSLPPLIRQNLYLIFKEAITNIAKHSNGDSVQIDLMMDKNQLELHIHDNGIFEGKSYKNSGMGLSNMQLRAKKLGGELKIDTEAGYEIILSIPSF